MRIYNLPNDELSSSSLTNLHSNANSVASHINRPAPFCPEVDFVEGFERVAMLLNGCF